MKQIKIRIGSKGKVEVETLGMKGKECLGYINEMERITNCIIEDSDYTDEYYERVLDTCDIKEEIINE